MFCLRTWLGLLLFLTNAPPIYVFLYLTATYVVQRPCVYCSILLLVLICSLFDFNADWFEPRYTSDLLRASETASSFMSGNSTVTDAIMETAGMAVTALNGTGGSLASAAMEAVRRRATGQGSNGTEGTAGAEWVRTFVEKRQIRIPCLDIMIGL